MRRAILLWAFVAALGLGGVLWFVSGGEGPPAATREAAPASARATADRSEPPVPLLRGRPQQPQAPAGEAGARTAAQPPDPAQGAGDDPRGQAPPSARRPGAEVRSILRWLSDAPRVPGRAAWPDSALGDPLRTPRVPLRTVLDDRAGSEREWAWQVGMTEIVDPEAPAASDADEEIEDPLVTAVTGAVLDPAGHPVPRADVILYSTFYERHVKYGNRVREVGRTVAREDGRFDLRPIRMDTVHFGADGEILITIRHPEFAPIVAKRLDGLTPETVNDLGPFTLSPETLTLSGTIRDLQGRPVEGAFLRSSGNVNPVVYDKDERQVILGDCPTARTDAEGRYTLGGLPTGRQHVSIHVNIDCVWHGDVTFPAGEHRLDQRVLAGHSLRGCVQDAEGRPIAAAVLHGGANTTHSYADGTYWLDNIQPGPFTLWVVHHLYYMVTVPDVRAGAENLDVVLDRPLPRVTLVCTLKETGQPVELISIHWSLAPGGPPGESVPESPFWHQGLGRFEVVVPERARGAYVAMSDGVGIQVAPELLVDGREIPLAFGPPATEDSGAASD